MTQRQLALDFGGSVVPIPECAADCLELSPEYKTVKGIADEIVREAKAWQQRNPGRDITEILPPQWKEYVIYRLNETKTK